MYFEWKDSQRVNCQTHHFCDCPLARRQREIASKKFGENINNCANVEMEYIYFERTNCFGICKMGELQRPLGSRWLLREADYLLQV